jgi:predicted RNA methylase
MSDIYSCDNCLKEFKTNAHYISHMNKIKCKNINFQTDNKTNSDIDKKIKIIIKKNINTSVKIDNENIKKFTKEIIEIEQTDNEEYHNLKKLQLKGLDRNTIDKYYTKGSVAEECIKLVKKYVTIEDNDLIIEPSAGNGSFIEYIKTLSNNYKFYDLEPEHDEVNKQDFLELNYADIIKPYSNIHVIGNPPFGRQSSMAIKFIKKCCLFSNSISFILPKSFRKDSMQKSFSQYYHLIYETDILNNSFLVNNVECNVPCIFQIWQHKNIPRPTINKQEPLYFTFVKKEEKPHISFRRVGVYAGIISNEINNKSIQSHYFIKFTNNKTIDENIEVLKSIKFELNNTVGPRSISKQELIIQFNKYL